MVCESREQTSTLVGGVMAETSGITQRIADEVEPNIVRPIQDFQDPSQEWRRLISELLGTFFLVLVAAGGGMMDQAFDAQLGEGRR
jgi:aquaporin Z